MSPPFMQLWVADYLGDTRHLTTEQHGAYLLLLMTMWRADGSLPADDTRLARIVGLTVSRWNKIKGDIVAMLVIEDGQITQKRLREELEKAREKSEKRAEAGRKGGSSKPLNKNNTPEANASDLFKHSSEPESEPESKKGEITSGVASRTPPAASPEFIRIPTNRFESQGEEVVISEQFVEEFQQLYPAVNVQEQLRSMRAWSIANNNLRKTKKGMTRFINQWLGRQQNKGVPRETAYGDRNGRQSSNQPFGSTLSRAVSERNPGSGLFSERGADVIVPARLTDQTADRDEDEVLGRTPHAA